MRFALVACTLVLFTVSCGPSPKQGDDDNVDAQSECAPNDAHRCVGATYQTCVGGTWQVAVDCPTACVDHLGCVDCVPGMQYCKDGNIHTCDADGNPGGESVACTGATTCVGAQCVDACADAAASKSYIGCEYWSVDLDNAQDIIGLSSSLNCALTPGVKNASSPVCFSNMGGGTIAGFCDPPGGTCPNGFTCQTQNICFLDAHLSPFGLVVSNPQAKPANVTVLGPGGQLTTRSVAAGQVVSILPQMSGITDQSVDGTVKAAKAYKVTSDLPIVAYQFNPLDNVNVFSNDASLLIPKTAFDTDYYVMSWPTLNRRAPAPGSHPFYGYVTIVAPQDNTQVEVTPTAAVQASATQASLAAGVPVTFTLNAHEVLQLEAADAGDLTGTHITSPNMMPFGVFGGHEAASFGETTPPDASHSGGPCCADHLEEMLFPSTTWGKAFAITRSAPRAMNVNPPDRLRILAQKAGTAVTFTPAPAATVSGNCAALGPGQFCEVKIAGDTEITSTEPVLIGHYLQSSIWQGIFDSVGSGDPSMAIAVPTEQYRRDYTILIPASYMNNYISISAPATGGVSVDGTPVTLTPFPGGGTHRAARATVTAGQHKITCADGCGILVYGYSDAVSYMFAGGLDLKPIVIL